VVLLAPLFDPFDPTSALVNPVNEARWRGDGVFSLLDLTTGQQTPVHYRFVEELRLLVSRPLEVEVPTLVVHGDRDEVVRSEQSRRFAAGRPNVQLRITQDDHGLLADPAGLAAVVESFLLERST
jgi:pimeloyl-ACP methyl ester carboxylesterase